MSRLKDALPLAGTGAAMGLAFFGAEELLHLALGQPHLQPLQILQVLPFYLLLPGLAGLVLGAIGFRGVAGALWLTAALSMAVMLGVGAAGAGIVGGVLGVILPPVVVIGVLYITRNQPDAYRWAAVAAGNAWLLFSSVLNSSGIFPVASGLGVGVNLALLVMAGALVGAVGKALGDRSPRVAAMALLLAALVWPLRAFLPSPTSRNLPKGKDGQGPAVLLVVVDGLRADHVSHLSGAQPSLTPELDALAVESFAYTATAGAPGGMSALGTLLTGQYPSTHRAGVDLRRLTNDHRTLADYAQDLGYVTGAVISKAAYGPGRGLEQGFGYYELFVGMGHTPVLLPTLDLLRLPLIRDRHQAGSERITDRAQEFIAQRGPEGWLLMVHYSDLLGPSPRSYQEDLQELDRQLGRLVEAAPQDAWIVVAGSHGLSLGEHPGGGQRVAGKGLWEEDLAVPLIIRRPRNNHPATVVRRVQTADLLPTMLDVLETNMLTGTDGEVLFEVFHRPAPAEPSIALAEMPDLSGTSVQRLEWKAVWRADSDSLHLYNIALDPGETQDFAGEQPRIAAEIAQHMRLVDWPAPPEPVEPAEPAADGAPETPANGG
ncbi:MAG: sulfatase-like hydrolase/transferase [Myxococcota bacterium]|nr:sulfatase-like hydrolase/transferase [Myxococcota bacterium]